MSVRITVKKGRLAFGQGLFEKQKSKDGKSEKFQCKMLLEPNDPQIKDIEAAELKVATEKWGPKGPGILKGLRAEGRTVIHDGDLKAEWDGFAGMKYVNASGKVKPTVKDQAANNAEDGVVYSGCYGHLFIELWAQDNEHGKRVNAQLRGFQKFKDGDAFAGGGTSASDDEFEPLNDPDAVDANDL